MENSPLTRLPPEIRLHIYEYAFLQNAPFEVKPSAGWQKPSDSQGPRSNPLALTQTCREINQECNNLFYAVNTFLIKGRKINYVFNNLEKFGLTIGREKTAELKEVILDIGIYDLSSFEEVFSAFSEWTIFLTRLRGLTLRGTGRGCNFVARARFMFLVPREAPAGYVFDVDFGGLERSWSESMRCIEQLMIDDLQYWRRLRPMFDDVFENLRLVDGAGDSQQ